MNKFFRVLIPIILVIAIVACIGWYLFIYDRDFTRDMLLQGARYFETLGNHSVSNWFYDQAYEQADDNDAVAIELANGDIVTGKTSSLLGASSAALLNALKKIAGIDDEIDVISPEILAPIQKLKTQNLGNHNPRLHTDEVLIALAISAVNNPCAAKAMQAISGLKNAEVHSTVILSQVDNDTFRKLGVFLTTEPKYQTKKLFHR